MRKWFCLIGILFLTPFFIIAHVQSETIPAPSEQKVDLIIGSQYKIINYIIRSLSKPLDPKILSVDPDFFTEPLIVPNRLFLYGPPGNGKTTLAREIAAAAYCEFVHISASAIVTKYQGSGAENIKKAFEKALDKVVESGRPVIIFIDEVDAIAITGISDSRAEDNKAMQELWQYLDKYKEDPRLFIICATNRFDELNETFTSRFSERQKLEIKKPDAALREKMLRKFAKVYEVDIEESLYADLAKGSGSCMNVSILNDALSIRELEFFMRNLKMLQTFEGPLTRKQIATELYNMHRLTPQERMLAYSVGGAITVLLIPLSPPLAACAGGYYICNAALMEAEIAAIPNDK